MSGLCIFSAFIKFVETNRLISSIPAPGDYTALPPMTDIIFDPTDSLVECVDIFIVRDLLVENNEQFFFRISIIQADAAVEVGLPSSAPVTIVDEPNGKHNCVPAEISDKDIAQGLTASLISVYTPNRACIQAAGGLNKYSDHLFTEVKKWYNYYHEQHSLLYYGVVSLRSCALINCICIGSNLLFFKFSVQC